MRIEHDLPLPMILMGEPLANFVKSLDCRCELVSEARRKTGNELLLEFFLVLHESKNKNKKKSFFHPNPTLFNGSLAAVD